MTELSYGCSMCGQCILDENGGICVPCGYEHSENCWTDQDGNFYTSAEAKKLLASGEATEVDL